LLLDEIQKYKEKLFELENRHPDDNFSSVLNKAGNFDVGLQVNLADPLISMI
jgi:hypothetical protein